MPTNWQGEKKNMVYMRYFTDKTRLQTRQSIQKKLNSTGEIKKKPSARESLSKKELINRILNLTEGVRKTESIFTKIAPYVNKDLDKNPHRTSKVSKSKNKHVILL